MINYEAHFDAEVESTRAKVTENGLICIKAVIAQQRIILVQFTLSSFITALPFPDLCTYI